MKKILVISAVFPPEPVVSAYLSFELVTALAATESVVVLSPQPTRPFGFKFDTAAQTGGFTHVVANSYTCPQSSIIGRAKESYSFGNYCYNYIVENHKDISAIYANTWPMFAQYFTVKAAKKFGIPIIVHIQDIYPESLSNKLPFGKVIVNAVLMPVEKFIFRHASKIVAISDKMKDFFIRSRKISGDKIAVIHNWQDEEKFIAYASDEDVALGTPFTFMYLGNIGPVAGCEILIDAFLQAGLDNSRLIIAGDGTEKKPLQDKVANLNMNTVEFMDVPAGQVQKVQSLANVMLLPMKKGSSSSSIPSKLPAYMFSKKPVIACVDTDSDTAAAITTANNGWICPSEDIEQLSKTMKTAFNMPQTELDIIGQRGFDYAMASFSKKANLNKLVKIITDNIKR